MAGSIYLPILSSFNPAGVNNAKTALGGLSGAFDGVKRALGLASAGFVAFRAVSETIDFGKSSIIAARDLERNLNALDSVFGELSPRMEQFAQNGVDIGLSQIQAAKSSTFLGSVLKQAGFGMEDVAGQTENLVGLASDLAVTYGYDVSEALSGMTALFRGEYDPIEKFGVAMKQSEVNAVLAANGQSKLTGAARRTAEQMARLALLYQRTQDAQGAFKDGAGTLFVEQQKLQAIFNNLQAEVGKALIPALVKVAEALQPLVKTLGPAITIVFTKFAGIITILASDLDGISENVKNFVMVLGGLFGVLEAILPFLLDNALALVALRAIFVTVNGAVALASATMIAYTTVTAAATASTAGLATTLRATPWGALATGVAVVAVVGFKIAEQFHKAYEEIEGVKEAANALSKSTTIGGPRVGAGRAAQGGAFANKDNLPSKLITTPEKFGKNLSIDAAQAIFDTKKVGEAQTDFEKTLEDLLKNFSGAVEETTAGSKKVSSSLKKVIDEQAAALKKEEDALNSFKKSLQDLIPALKPLQVATREIGEFEKSAIDAFENIAKKVDDAFGEGIITAGAAREFSAYLATEKQAFIAINRQRDELINKRTLAQTLITDIKQAIMGVGSLAGLLETETRQVTVATTKIVDGFTITTKRTVDEVVGGKGVISKLAGVVSKTKAFAGQLTKLKALGLNENLFKQIVEAGPDVGGQLANEILDGGTESVKALNTTFKELEDVAGQVAEQTAVVMYNSGIEVAGGLVNGLLSQEQALVAAAEAMANAFVNAFNALMSKLQVPLVAGGQDSLLIMPTFEQIQAGMDLAGTKEFTGEARRFAQAAINNNISVVVNAGMGTNGKKVGQEFTSAVNQYLRSNA